MKVLMLRNPATHLGCSLVEGETGTVSETVGRALLAGGIAVRIDEPLPPVIQTVPPPPAIAEATPPEIMPDVPSHAGFSVLIGEPTTYHKRESPEIVPDASETQKANFPWRDIPAAVPIPKVRKSKNKES